MTTTRETMTGRMKPITNTESKAATRQAFLWTLAGLPLTVTAHAAYLLGVQLGYMIVNV